MLVEDPPDHNADLGAGAFAERPVDGYALTDLRDEFSGDHLELVS